MILDLLDDAPHPDLLPSRREADELRVVIHGGHKLVEMMEDHIEQQHGAGVLEMLKKDSAGTVEQ